MASLHSFPILASLLLLLHCTLSDSSSATMRKLTAVVQPQPLSLKYHNGTLLKGNVKVHLIWYGKFSTTQHSLITDFLESINSSNSPPPPVASWWQTTQNYKGGSSNLVLRNQVLDVNYSLGKSLSRSQIMDLALKAPRRKSINVVLTAADVAVEGFCKSSCGTHGWSFANPKDKQSRFVYAWVGNPMNQCPGQCAWPFHKPMYGPQTQPLVAPNGDVGVDGMVINLATVLAGAVTNPYNSGYYQGSAKLPLEAVTACTGIYGSGAYPGHPGSVLVDNDTGASYNAQCVKGRKYLLPAMWDPKTSTCKTVV